MKTIPQQLKKCLLRREQLKAAARSPTHEQQQQQ
jgi:hypothetical protein